MKSGVLCLLVSASLHAVVLGGGALLEARLGHHDGSRVVDLSLVELQEPGGGSEGEKGLDAPALHAAAAPHPSSPPQDEPRISQATTATPVLSTSEESAPVATPSSNLPMGMLEAQGAEGGKGSSSEGRGGGSGGGIGPGKGSGTGNGLEILRQIYLREHFAYIRERIARQLVYPRSAIRAGWGGRVIVTFLIQQNGQVSEARIQRGCGIPVLERDALETIHRAAPFPPPPVAARLTLPVDYAME